MLCNVTARILYVDYGNEELVKCGAIRCLQSKFCHLPCQAITCSLSNTTPTDHSGAWTAEISSWFTNLLFGATLNIAVVSCIGPNAVTVDAFLTISQLMDSLMTNFAIVPDKQCDTSTVMSLSVFMHQTGLARLGSCVPVLPDSSEETSSYSNYEPLKNGSDILVPNTSTPSRQTETDELVRLSDLPSLIVNLTESDEFMCMVSVVSKELFVYVHPVECSVAHSITYLNSILQDHYSREINRIPIPKTGLKSKVLCVAFSKKFEEWCRAMIVATQSHLSTEEQLDCLIFYLDYGGSVWESSSELYTLTPSLSKYPASVICCSLDNIQEGLPRTNHEVKKPRMLSEVQEEAAAECALSLAEKIENKPLVAVVRVEKGN